MVVFPSAQSGKLISKQRYNQGSFAHESTPVQIHLLRLEGEVCPSALAVGLAGGRSRLAEDLVQLHALHAGHPLDVREQVQLVLDAVPLAAVARGGEGGVGHKSFSLLDRLKTVDLIIELGGFDTAKIQLA